MGTSFVKLFCLLSSVPEIVSDHKHESSVLLFKMSPFQPNWVYIDEVTFGKPLRKVRMGGGLPREPVVLRGLEISVSPPTPTGTSWEGRGARDWAQSAMVSDFINRAYVMKPLHKSKRMVRFGELPGCVSTWQSGESDVPGKGREAPSLSPQTLPNGSGPSSCLWVLSFCKKLAIW